ncbi:hypothetical protein CDS [Bradyrhizobium sp.]|nr:hypothetical protein CDS [Bradyrhizobium sp.]
MRRAARLSRESTDCSAAELDRWTLRDTAREAVSMMVCQSWRRRTKARVAVTAGRWIGIVQP